MSRSIRCSDQAYQRVTAVTGEKGLSLIEALDDIIIITKQSQVGKLELDDSPALGTAPATNTGPFFQFEGIKTREELKETMREALKEGLRQNQPARPAGDRNE